MNDKAVEELAVKLLFVGCNVPENKIEKLASEFIIHSDDEIDFSKYRCIVRHVLKLKAKWEREARKEMLQYCHHDESCLCSQYRQGKPTDDGDYLTLFGFGKEERWYSRNKKEEPECSCILAELEWVKSKDMDKDGKLKLVGKDVVKENIGRSPDYSDMIMMRMWFENG